MQQLTDREIEGTEVGGHPAFTMAGVAPVKTVTDHWVTSQPNPDATDLASLPEAMADLLDGQDHSDDPVLPDEGGTVLNAKTAEANRSGSR